MTQETQRIGWAAVAMRIEDGRPVLCGAGYSTDPRDVDASKRGAEREASTQAIYRECSQELRAALRKADAPNDYLWRDLVENMKIRTAYIEVIAGSDGHLTFGERK